METFSFTKESFLVGGKPVYLNSGEFHYFRVPKQEWRRRMELLKAMGGNAVATYVPWLIHEPEEGHFLLDQGDGMTDLTEFLECAKEAGLYVTVRLGPYSYSELRYNGIPAWLLNKYPEILSQRRDGTHHSPCGTVSYLHPVFLEKVRKWYAAICPIVAKFTQKNGGPVCLVQVDNELTGLHIWSGDRDFHPVTMGFGQAGGRYPLWLKKKYGTVPAVNAAYGTDKTEFTGFSPADEPKDGVEKLRWNADYQAFYNSTIAEYIITLISYAEENGVESLFCHNSANPWHNPQFREAKKLLGDKFLLGSDHYYALSQGWGQNNPTPDFMMMCFMSIEALRLMGNPPSVLEAQWGSVCEWPPTSAEDIEAEMMCYLACGAKGSNGYVYTGGPNPPNCGTTCITYDYDAPVAADGTCRPAYDALKRFGMFVEKHPELAADKPDSDVRIMMPWRAYPGLSGRVDPKRGMQEGLFGEYILRGLLSCLFAANLQPEFIDGESDDWVKDFSTPVIIPCTGYMAADVQKRFLQFIQAGGKVIFNPVIPFADENFNPCTILADALGISSGDEITRPEKVTDVSTCDGVRLDFGTGEIACNTAGCSTFGAGGIPENAKILGTDLTSGRCVAWSTGSVAWNGVAHWLLRKAHRDAWRVMFEATGGTARWKSDNSWVMTFRRKTEKGTLVFLANLGTSRQWVTPSVRKDAESPWRELPRMELAPMEVKTISL